MRFSGPWAILIGFLQENLSEFSPWAGGISRRLTRDKIIESTEDYSRRQLDNASFSAAIRKLESHEFVDKIQFRGGADDAIWSLTPKGTDLAWNLIRHFEDNYEKIKVKGGPLNHYQICPSGRNYRRQRGLTILV